MESRDLTSSSPSSTTNRDSPSAEVDDGVFALTVALAKDASLHYQSGKFAECVDVMQHLLLNKPNDPKVFNLIQLIPIALISFSS